MIFVFLTFLHLVQSSLGPFMLLQMAAFHCVLWLNSIYSGTSIYKHVGIYSFFDGYFHCFHVLAIVNNAPTLLEA